MPEYPIERIPVKPYSGSNERKRQAYCDDLRMAKEMQDYLNSEMERRGKPDSEVFLYGFIASELMIPKDKVELFGMSIAGSNNSIRLWKPTQDSTARHQ